MALPEEWKDLLQRWNKANHPVGDPKLDALGDINNNVSLSYAERMIRDGRYYTGFISRQTTSPETVYRVVKTNDKAMVLEDVFTDIDFSSVNDGEVQVVTRVYSADSDISDWSYTGGTPVKPGRQLNFGFVNQEPDTDYIVDPVVTITPESLPDITISYLQIFVDTNGNRNFVGQNNSNVLGGGRKLIIPPNSEALIEVVTGGDPGNTINLITFLNFVE